MTSRPGSQTIVIHILANISRSKHGKLNQKIKHGQLIEHNKRNILLKIMREMRHGD